MSAVPILYGYAAGSQSAFYSVIIRFFRDKKALSEPEAVAISDLDWAEIGIFNGPQNPNWKNYKDFIKETSGGKFWLDYSGLVAYKNDQKKKFRRGMTILSVVVIICGLLLLPLGISDPSLLTPGNILIAIFMVGVGSFFLVFIPRAADRSFA